MQREDRKDSNLILCSGPSQYENCVELAWDIQEQPVYDEKLIKSLYDC